MKRFFTSLAVLAVLSTGFITACGQSNTKNQTNQTSTNSSANTALNNAVSSASNQTNAASNSSSTNTTMTQAELTSVAQGLVQRYINSHNDKTQQEYTVDISQILIPGLAQAVASSARSGIDFNHPVKSSTVSMSQVVALNKTEIHAVAKVSVVYADGKSENTTYHLMMNQDPSSQQWLIRTIG